ncbi:hypothetical protein FYA99_18905 [Bordetella parapertussis]|uniref:SCP2 domain-containing protein n=4 Tax=Bordetella TaxID=517 RepID=K0MBX8_BORPB|nr:MULTISPECIES: hypothetical protein [Bordetella]AMG90169.1 hypothetical protein AL472_22315 [Bordetella bronchiseptica]AOB40644.1 hypothetical protein BBB43_18740 [Bordetella parapertussis]AUL44681.1 hypothetical protein BTL54_18860 [Bordetella parapertussis]AWP64581.1 hypothetical protein B7P06_18870 [Bordetella parapertussis]AWP72088.1 hypothetical protein B7O99_18860 [Bordetella parapertussis]
MPCRVVPNTPAIFCHGKRAMFFEDIERIRSALQRSGRKYLTPRLEAVLGTVYQLKRGEESVYLCVEPSMVVREHAHRPHCTIQLGAPDWDTVLSGERSIMSKVLAGKCGFLKHERRYIMHFSMLLQAVLLEEKQ